VRLLDLGYALRVKLPLFIAFGFVVSYYIVNYIPRVELEFGIDEVDEEDDDDAEENDDQEEEEEMRGERPPPESRGNQMSSSPNIMVSL